MKLWERGNSGVLRLGLGHEGLLSGRDHLELDALQHVALPEVGEALQQDAALCALADALHVQAVPLEAGADALVYLLESLTTEKACFVTHNKS